MNPVTVIESCSGPMVTVVHQGPQGNPGPAGAPGEMTGPASSVDNEIALFSGTSGKVLKNSATLLSALATVANLALKENSVPGKGLSANDFTNALKAKLDALNPGGFVGTYVSDVLLEADFPTATDGSYAYIADTGLDQILAIWDNVNTTWLYLDFDGKVDKVTGYGLSQNDLTNARLALINGAVQQTVFDAAVLAFQAAIDGIFSNVVTEATVARTLAVGDTGLYIRLTNASGCTITLPDDATGLWDSNHEIRFRIETAAVPTITTTTTVTDLAVLAALGINDNFTLKRVGADEWHIIV